MPEQKITFLRSTTTTTVDREADGDTSTEVAHIARFAVEPGAVPDMVPKYSRQTIRPEWLQVGWRDGRLVSVHASGPLVLKDGGTSKKLSRSHDWTHYGRKDFVRTELPEAVQATIADYEKHIAVASARGNGNGGVA